MFWNLETPMTFASNTLFHSRSMIAKFPNDHHNFMGDNLEIICLFQSAEIERLTEFLDDYKFRYFFQHLRYREIERR